jgi:hypothetical protein
MPMSLIRDYHRTQLFHTHGDIQHQLRDPNAMVCLFPSRDIYIVPQYLLSFCIDQSYSNGSGQQVSQPHGAYLSASLACSTIPWKCYLFESTLQIRRWSLHRAPEITVVIL